MNKTAGNGDQPAMPNDMMVLDELVAGEDEFDVDLMACGCRVAPTTKMNLGIEDVIRLFKLSDEQITILIGALVDEAKISPDRFLDMADRVSRGKVVEASLKPGDRVTIAPLKGPARK